MLNGGTMADMGRGPEYIDELGDCSFLLSNARSIRQPIGS